MSVYPGERISFDHEGLSYVADVEFDDSYGAPWEECEGFFPVVRVRHDYRKRPGERFLHKGGFRDHSYVFDYAEAVRTAKRDEWGGEGKTKGERAVSAVESAAEFLRGWCANEWCYVGVTVRRADSKGKPVGQSVSLWGVDSCGDYARNEVMPGLADDLRAINSRARIQRTADARKLAWRFDSLALLGRGANWTRRQINSIYPGGF